VNGRSVMLISRTAAHNKQLQRTVTRRRGDAASAPLHFVLAARFTRQCAAAELCRYAARSVVLALSLVFALSCGNAAELLESVRLVNGGAVLSCDYTHPDDSFKFACRDAYTVFALRCVSVAWSALSVQRADQQEFVCPVSADRSAFGNALRLRCTAYGAASNDELYSRDKLWRTAPNPRLLVDGRMPTHNCHSAKVDVE
jgi:hypothetical protein